MQAEISNHSLLSCSLVFSMSVRLDVIFLMLPAMLPQVQVRYSFSAVSCRLVHGVVNAMEVFNQLIMGQSASTIVGHVNSWASGIIAYMVALFIALTVNRENQRFLFACLEARINDVVRALRNLSD